MHMCGVCVCSVCLPLCEHEDGHLKKREKQGMLLLFLSVFVLFPPFSFSFSVVAPPSLSPSPSFFSSPPSVHSNTGRPQCVPSFHPPFLFFRARYAGCSLFFFQSCGFFFSLFRTESRVFALYGSDTTPLPPPKRTRARTPTSTHTYALENRRIGLQSHHN